MFCKYVGRLPVTFWVGLFCCWEQAKEHRFTYVKYQQLQSRFKRILIKGTSKNNEML